MRTFKKGRVFLLDFHSELNVGRNVIKVVKEGIEERMVMRSNEKGIINKPKPTKKNTY
jgi:hypothetical protein